MITFRLQQLQQMVPCKLPEHDRPDFRCTKNPKKLLQIFWIYSSKQINDKHLLVFLILKIPVLI